MNARFFFSTSILLTVTIAGTAQAEVFAPVLRFTFNGTLSESKISNGPWTLSNATTAINSTNQTPNYCTGSVETSNTALNVLQPYYSPFVYTSPLDSIPTTTTNNSLQAYFDYRVSGTDEAIVAASSTDGGVTWSSSQELLELNPNLCATNSSGTNNASSLPGASDAGQGGNPYVMTINGKTFLYTLDRSKNALVVNTLSSSTNNKVSLSPVTSTGLTNFSGIIGDDGNYPRRILYVQKQTTSTPGATTYSNTCGGSTDTITVHIARTTDGLKFTDLGPTIGLNDPTTNKPTGTRFIGSRGTLITLPRAQGYGLVFSGGTCSDTDSEGYHYIGYAESNNLIDWTIINGLDNASGTVGYAAYPPIASINASDIPTTTPPVGIISPSSALYSWTNGRLNAPNLVVSSYNNNYNTSTNTYPVYTFNLIFSGSNTTSPSGNYSSYRTIYRYPLTGTVYPIIP